MNKNRTLILTIACILSLHLAAQASSTGTRAFNLTQSFFYGITIPGLFLIQNKLSDIRRELKDVNSSLKDINRSLKDLKNNPYRNSTK